MGEGVLERRGWGLFTAGAGAQMSLEAQLEAAEESLAAAQEEALRLRRLLAAEQRGGAGGAGALGQPAS